ncbi:hypothetical protein [Paraburkholderia sp. GAS348]|uniref:hypothetical protein n=1 Tax=Paraburkholderia sp. GAS348 TaxID=3035132 RepID=UPI003D19C287
MGFHITNPDALAGTKVVAPVTSKQAKPRRGPRTGNTKPRPVMVSLDQPGRLRVGHLLTLLSISSVTLYKGLNLNDDPARPYLYPKPDGYMGRSPYWNTRTIREFLESGKVKQSGG